MLATVHVQFPQMPLPACTARDTVAFPIVVNGQPAMAEISADVLVHRFGATSGAAEDLIAAFQWHRVAIEAIGRLKLPARLATGRGLLSSADF